MAAPLFSILIPTRDRTDVLASSLEAALSQQTDNCEVIVLDNAGPPECGELVRALGDSRVSHLRSDQLISMSENWERGIDAAQGEYLFYCGDDDGLLPDATTIAEGMRQLHPGVPIAWQQAIYHWNSVPIESLRNRVLLPGKGEAGWVFLADGRAAVKEFYQFRNTYRDLPGVYNSFVPRAIIDRTVEKFGRYFASPIPDVWSALATCAETPQFIYSNRPLSVGGVSTHSTGFSQNFRHLHGKSTKKFEKENQAAWKDELDPRLENPLGPTGDIYVCDTMLKASESLFDQPGPQLSFPRLIDVLIKGLGRYGDQYEEAVSMVRIIAERNRVTIDEDSIPEREQLPRTGGGGRNPGFRKGGGGGGLRLFPDPSIVRDVYDAAIYVSALIPSAQTILESVSDLQLSTAETAEAISEY